MTTHSTRGGTTSLGSTQSHEAQGASAPKGWSVSRSPVQGRDGASAQGGGAATGQPGRLTARDLERGVGARQAQASSPTPSQPQPQGSAGAPDETEVKTFVLDTNILLYNPDAVFVFQDNHVVIPFMVIEELDKMKRKDDDLGRNARACIRHLDRLRAIGSLTKGVDWGLLPMQPNAARSAGPGGRTGTIRIDVTDYERPAAIREDAPDNAIIAVAWHLTQQGVRAVFVTKDLSARIKSDSLGIKTEDFENQRVDADRLYTGFVTAEVEGGLIDELYRDRLLEVSRLTTALQATTAEGHTYTRELNANQFVVLRDEADEHPRASAGGWRTRTM